MGVGREGGAAMGSVVRGLGRIPPCVGKGVVLVGERFRLREAVQLLGSG